MSSPHLSTQPQNTCPAPQHPSHLLRHPPLPHGAHPPTPSNLAARKLPTYPLRNNPPTSPETTHLRSQKPPTYLPKKGNLQTRLRKKTKPRPQKSLTYPSEIQFFVSFFPTWHPVFWPGFGTFLSVFFRGPTSQISIFGSVLDPVFFFPTYLPDFNFLVWF